MARGGTVAAYGAAILAFGYAAVRHAGLWDLWFLVWGILLAVATVGSGRLSRGRSGIRRARSR